MTSTSPCRALSQGNVAQQIFWYTAFTSSMVAPKSDGNNTVDDAGKPLWRMAPSPHGPYWEEGQKLGYQDAGSWTLFKSTPVDRRKAAWLYAQFVVSKTVSLKKTHVGLTIDPRQRHPSRVLHRACAEARRSGGVLPLARPRALVADRRQRAGLSQAGADLVAADRRRQLRRLHPAAGDGPAGVRNGRQVMARMQAADEKRQHLWRLRPAPQRAEGRVRPGSARAARRRPSWTTKSPRARPSTTKS